MVTLANLAERWVVGGVRGGQITYHIMNRTKVMHWGLSAIKLLTSSSSSGVMGAALRTTERRFTCSNAMSVVPAFLDYINDINLPWRLWQEEGKWSPQASILSSHGRRIWSVLRCRELQSQLSLGLTYHEIWTQVMHQYQHKQKQTKKLKYLHLSRPLIIWIIIWDFIKEIKSQSCADKLS